MKSLYLMVKDVLNKYSVLVAALVIYSYFLFTSINLMEHASTKRTIIDFVLQFDSLILMWLVAFVVVQMQRYRKLASEQQQRQRQMQMEVEYQRTKLRLIEEVTLLFQESLAKPLAIVSTATQSLRERFGNDPDAHSWADHIDFAMARVSATPNDIRAYETRKIVEGSNTSSLAQHPSSSMSSS